MAFDLPKAFVRRIVPPPPGIVPFLCEKTFYLPNVTSG
jgi:hypothetical protein